MANLYAPTLTEDRLFTTGLRNRWHAICPSSHVEPGAIHRVTRLGQDWVVFRKSDGTVGILEDRCPHRGAPLSHGKNLGDRVQCIYHGVQVDSNGVVVSVPGMPGCAIEGETLVNAPVVQERSGVIMAWFGLTPADKPVELNMPTPLVDPEVSSFLCYAEWNSNWRFVMENLLDPMHGTFLHHESHAMSEGDIQAKFRIQESGRGFIFEKTDQVGVNFDWVELCHTGTDWVDLSIPYPKSAGPGGPFGIVGMVTPIDETRSAIFFWRYRRVEGWLRDTWRFLYKTTLEPRHWHVLEQDRVLLEGLAEDADSAENLYQHDLGVMRVRRLFKQQARTQAKAFENSKPAKGARSKPREAVSTNSDRPARERATSDV